MLSIEGIELYYGDAQALGGVSLQVSQGEIVAIIGANGAGKTSLIHAVAGIHKPQRGRVTLDGNDITGWSCHRVCDLGIGQVAEGRQVFPNLSVLENLEMGAVVPRARSVARSTLDQVFELFPRLRERRTQAAGTLSGGEQQMLAIGRCLMGQPKMIMFDEPSLGLAPRVVQEVFEVIRNLHQEGMTILLVEQNVALSLRMAQHAYVLENGHIVTTGTGDELLSDNRVREAYLGL